MNSTIDLRRLAGLIKDIKFTMLSTVTNDGSIISRPMANQEIAENSFDGRLWFFTKSDTVKVHSIVHDSHVNLAYANPARKKYVSVSGRASIIKDKTKMKELWGPLLKAWFPLGLEDPELTLIAVDIESFEVWDTPAGKFVQFASFLKSREVSNMKFNINTNAIKNKIQHYKVSLSTFIDHFRKSGDDVEAQDAKVDEASRESFPASDSPGHISKTAVDKETRVS